VTWLPRIREVGWFKTGEDGPDGSGRYADRRLFVRLQQDMNGTGEWTLELHDCGKAADGRATRVYDNEQDARTALALVYALTRHLGAAAGSVQRRGRDWAVGGPHLRPVRRRRAPARPVRGKPRGRLTRRRPAGPGAVGRGRRVRG